MCSFEKPNTPRLSATYGKVNIPEGKYTFAWENNNKDEMCGVNLKYTYGVSITPDGEPDDFKNYTDTSITLDIKTGSYSWKVITSNGILTSDTVSETMTFCVPQDIP